MKRDANKTTSKTRQARTKANGSGRLAVTLTGDQRDLLADTEYGKEFQPGPVRVNPESKEKREKRLAARKARTLRAFRWLMKIIIAVKPHDAILHLRHFGYHFKKVV